MSQPSTGPKPYQQLGVELRNLRHSSRETLAEVSGAVEIDEHVLERFEAGIECPDVEILNLLIRHYKLKDNIADQLWELAGYSDQVSPEEAMVIEEATAVAKQLIMVLASDGRTIYTDGVNIAYNKNGLQMTFTQSLPQNKAMVVSRLGMSYEQANDVMKVLGIALTYAKFAGDHPLLPPGKM